MKRLRVAAVGTGGIFRNAHYRRGYVHLPEAQIVGLCDIKEEALEAAKKAMRASVEKLEDDEKKALFLDDLKRVRLFTDLDEMLKELDLDVVDVCTMPNTHGELSVRALEAGANVLCEKPMARTWLETVPVVEACERTGRYYQHNENWIWDPKWYSMRKLIESGDLGQVVAVYISATHGGPEGNPAFWDPFLQGGGCVPDMAIHALSTAWFLAGFEKEAAVVQAASPVGLAKRFRRRIIAGSYREIRAEDDAHFLVRFEDPSTGSWTTAFIEGAWSYSDAPETCIIGSAGRARFAREEGKPAIEVVTSRGTRSFPVSGPTWEVYPSSYYGEIRDFLRSVAGGRPPLVDARIGSESQAIAGAVYMSEARKRSAVKVEEFKAHALELREKHGERASDVLIEEALAALGS